MIPVPAELESHLQGEVTSHCFAWLIRRSDGIVLGFTDHDRTVEVGDIACEPLTGLNSSEASTALGLSVAGGEVEGVLSSVKISDADIEQGRYDGASIEAYLVNWSEPGQHMLLRRWTAGKISRSGSRFVMELKGAAAAFDAVRGRRVLRHCDASLGDSRCGINIDDPRYFADGTVLTAEGLGLTASGLDGFASGWFAGGVLHWTGGANAGRNLRVTVHAGQVLNLAEPPVLPVAQGDAFRIIAGCDKSFATCKAKFGNGLNFRGFPHLPGNDAAYAYINGGGEYDGSALVP
ncbi:hypothetical protein CN878_00265 [Ochrobactrum sp. 695/2009]|nr:hypothetical protein CN881_13415 [Ochrobactrum sp. 721/2009]PJT16536.1 hypothetical protein CN880_09315 [Ochrobactrum sp. 720/2009]PJT26358.1 hypothetical protein CN879_05280 [Ochrobactrum sp. 715/2009]PJT31670.1 hypothetical protein CN878_00265 [Ochrobactrum sp. 695/2009]PJT35877.1 hypothetical protein CN877_07725 [Ochrobactrum sp. 689/2009]